MQFPDLREEINRMNGCLKKQVNGFSLIKRKYYLQYLAVFTLSFLILFYLCFAIWFYKYDKTFLRYIDGLDQHYLAFLYIGELIRNFFHDLAVNHTLVLPLWNMGIGYGADIPTSLAAYLPDPFNWIAAFFPGEYAEKGFELMLLLKVYAAGLAFSWFCFDKRQGRFATLMGSILYMFSGTVYIIFIESFFVNPLYIFPFVLAGVNRIWNGKNSALYVFSLAFSFINYFYFAYMICIFVFLYCVLKFLGDKEKRTLKLFCMQAGRILFFSCIALGMAMVILLPIALVLVEMGRLGVKYDLPLFYGCEYYKGLLKGFISSYSMLGRDCLIGYGSFSLLAVFALFIKKKEKQLRVIFIILTAGLGLPVFGSIMNGFSYTANRWVWAYALCVCFMAVKAIPVLYNLDVREKLFLIMAVLLYVVTVQIFLNDSNKATNIAILNLILVLILLLVGMKKHYESFKMFVASAVLLSVWFSSFLFFGHRYENIMYYEVGRGAAYTLVSENPAITMLSGLVNKNLDFRYDETGTNRIRNTSWLYGISGMDFYMSIYNGSIDRFHNNLALLTGSVSHDYQGLNRRSDLEWLMNVQYYLANSIYANRLPYGFDELAGEKQKGEERFLAYKRNRNNSFVLGFKKAFAQKDYAMLSPFERQQLLMHGVVLQDGNDKIPVLPDYSIRSELKASKYLTLIDDIIEKKKKNGILSCVFDNITNSELYLYVEGIDTDDNQGFVMDALAFCNGKFIDSSGLRICTANNKTHMYGNKHKWLINLGLVDEANEIKLLFSEPGRIKMEKIQVYAEPVNTIQSHISNLVSLTEDLQIKNNEIQFSLLKDSFPYAFLSVPYSIGWTATIDGEKREILKADDAFMAIPLQKGDHKVQLLYRTPGLLPGALISVMSLFGYVLYLRKLKKCA